MTTTSLSRRSLSVAVLVFIGLIISRPARAGEVQLGLTAGGAATEWRRDAAAYTSLKLGYRFHDIASIYVLGRAGYASVDERILGALELGGQLWGRIGRARPYVRLGLFHQHEEPYSAARAQILDSIFGTGDGIRHRYGADLGLGVDVPFFTHKSVSLFATAEATGFFFHDSRGPQVYAGGQLGIGMSYSL